MLSLQMPVERKLFPMSDKSQPGRGFGQVALDREAVSNSPAPSPPGQVRSGRPPQGTIATHTHEGPPCARNFQAFRVIIIAVIVVHSD